MPRSSSVPAASPWFRASSGDYRGRLDHRGQVSLGGTRRSAPIGRNRCGRGQAPNRAGKVQFWATVDEVRDRRPARSSHTPARRTDSSTSDWLAGGGVPGRAVAVSDSAVRRKRRVPPTRCQTWSFGTFLLPCSAMRPLMASSKREPAKTVAVPASGNPGRTPSAQSSPGQGRYRRDECIGQVLGDDPRCAPGPEDRADDSAHCRTDGDVFEAHDPYFPPDRDEDVEQDEDRHRETTPGRWRRGRCRARDHADEHRYRQGDPQGSGVAPDGDDQPGADEEPTTVPPRARSAVAPVAAALVRSTEIVPSTTEKPCCTLVTSATATATATASVARALFRNQTDRKEACPLTSRRALSSATTGGPTR